MSLGDEVRELLALSRADERRNRLAGEVFRTERALGSGDSPERRLAFARAAALWLMAEADWAAPDRRAQLMRKLVGLAGRLSREPEDRPVARVLGELVELELARPHPPASAAAPRAAAGDLMHALRARLPFDVVLGKTLAHTRVEPPPATPADAASLEMRAADLEFKMIDEVLSASSSHRAMGLGERSFTLSLTEKLVTGARDAAHEAVRVAAERSLRMSALRALAGVAGVLGWTGAEGRGIVGQSVERIVSAGALEPAEARACERVLLALVGAVSRPEHRERRRPGTLFEHFVTSPLELDLYPSLHEVVALAARIAGDRPELAGADARTALHAVFHLAGARCWEHVPRVLEAARVPRATRCPRTARAAYACLDAWVTFARYHGERVQEHRALGDWGRQIEIAPPVVAAAAAPSSAARRARLAWEHAQEDGDHVAAEVLLSPLLGLPDPELRVELAWQRDHDACGFWAERAHLLPSARE
jgi:hypothetical protein